MLAIEEQRNVVVDLLGKVCSVRRNDATIEDVLEEVFLTRSVPRRYKRELLQLRHRDSSRTNRNENIYHWNPLPEDC
jgi:hypothetical protein